ncbi:hypothetical protein ACJJTC_013958, partial [Scirpophaga incertulas]
MEESWSSGGAPLLRTRSLPLVLEAASGAPTRQAKLDPRQLLTLTRHYYPEGGWGWGIAAAATLAQLLAHGLHQASAVLAVEAVKRFGPEFRMQAGCLGALSAGVALALSPVTVALCVRKSTRVTAVVGGLVAALGCLFTSFATQFHQLFFSY